ncbi:F-box domain-containing protein [Mycena venus]|uniref:F-box domain-containing protein n=1 Tax=Mycena venus TaxID=2733690 RepID=A0A8H7CHT2_9AGAR|nr:F-box domain-containing protein [Mycena venus]
MNFQDLPEDTIRLILSFCDIYSVVSMSRTSKYLRRLCLDKLVWVDLVANLRRKGFVDQLSLSDIQSYSQEGLVALVKGLLTGPASWKTAPVKKSKSHWFRNRSVSSESQTNFVQISNKYIVHPPGVVASKMNQPKLLNGGEYVLFNNVTLECWNVRRDELVWAYEKNGPKFHIMEFAAEVVDGEDSVNIVVCERSWTHGGEDQSLVQIVKLDLSTGCSTQLLLNENPGSNGKPCGFTDAKICGHIACVVVESWSEASATESTTPHSYCILMDWKTETHLKLVANTWASPFLVTLIAEHLIFVTKNASGGPEISIINISTTLSSHWRSIAGLNGYYFPLDPIYTTQLEAIIRESITFPKCKHLKGQWKRDLCAYESPLQAGTYRIWVSLYGYSRPSSKEVHAVLWCYRLSLPKRSGDRTEWRQRIVATADPVRSSSGISYSGHSRRDYAGGPTVFGPGDTIPTEVNLSTVSGGNSSCAHISTYSGALTSLTDDNNLLVVYYKWCVLCLEFLFNFSSGNRRTFTK